MAQELPSTASLACFCQKLNRLKPLEYTMETSLRRCLTTLDLTLLGVGCMVGSGLYVLTGTVAKEMAGPAVLMSFGVAAVASLLAALCYAEFGARVPRTGSAYLFTYVSIGELWAFLIGWDVLLEYLIGGAATARAWSSYLDSIFSHRIRNFTEAHVGIWQVPFLARYPDFLAAGIVLLASTFISCGARISSWVNRTFSAISLAIILFIIILGFVLARPHNWSAEEGGFAPFGFSGIMTGTATCFYAFVGFDVIAASSEEARNPKRAVPMAIAISLGLAAGAYILVSTVLTLMVPWHSLDPNSALADAFYQRGYSWAGFIVAAGSICGKGPFWTMREGTGWWGPALSLQGAYLHLGLCSQLHPGPRKVLMIKLSTRACWEGPPHRPSQLYIECQFWACTSRSCQAEGLSPHQILQWACHLNWGVPFLGGEGEQSSTHIHSGSLSEPRKLMPMFPRGHPCPGPQQQPLVGLPTTPTSLPHSVTAMNTVLLTALFSLPRIIYAMAVDGLFFHVFAHVHPRTQVPVVGILVFGALMAFLVLLLDLEALVQFLSIGTLMAYTFVATSIIVLRFQKAPPASSLGPASPGPMAKEYNSFSDHIQLVGTEPASAPEPGQLRPALRPYLGFLGGCRPGAAVAWALGVLVASAITLGCVLVFGDSALQLPPWGYTLLLLLSSATFLLSLLVLGAHQQQHRQDTFQLSYLTWLRFSIWLLIGLVVYFGYGIRHSKENQRERSELTATHYVVYPSSSLEATVQAVQPPSQAPAKEPGHTEQPAQSMSTAGVLPSLPHLLRRPEGLAAPLSRAAQVCRPAHAVGYSGPQDLSPGAELRVFGSGLWPALVWWTLPSAFQFMTNSSYLGRWSRAGREEARTPGTHNNSCSANHVVCCCVHCGVLCVNVSSPAPGNQMIVLNPQQRCRGSRRGTR
nr:PREDICTED: cationic amino acid transporter 4-like isoform X2 [Equus przewalskii]